MWIQNRVFTVQQEFSWCFPFDEKFRFEFPDISSDNWNIIYWNFRKRGWGIPISQREFPFHLSFLPEFPGFSAEWFDGRKFNNFQKKTFLGSSYHLCPFWNFRNFWLTRKHSLILLTIAIRKYLSDIWLRVRITVSADDSCFSMICWCRILYCTQMLWLPMNSAHASPRYDSHIPWSGGRVL